MLLVSYDLAIDLTFVCFELSSDKFLDIDVGDEDDEDETGDAQFGFRPDVLSSGGEAELLDEDNELNEDMKPLSVICTFSALVTSCLFMTT